MGKSQVAAWAETNSDTHRSGLMQTEAGGDSTAWVTSRAAAFRQSGMVSYELQDLYIL